MSQDAASQLASIQKEFEEKQQELKNQFAKKRTNVLLKLELELVDAFKAAHTLYEKIPADAREEMFSKTVFTDLFKSLGLFHKKLKRSRARTRRGNTLKNVIYDFLSEKPVSLEDIKAHVRSEGHDDKSVSATLTGLKNEEKIYSPEQGMWAWIKKG